MTTEKKILTDRFIKAYYELVDNNDIIPMNFHGDKSLEYFAKRISLDAADIGFILAGRQHINHDNAQLLCQEYGISKDFMFGDVTNVFELTSSRAGNIIFVEDVEFFCGEGAFSAQQKQFKRFSDPTVQGEYYAFKASGNSMEATIVSGDVVYGRKLEKPNYLNIGDVCAIATLDKAMIKRVIQKKFKNDIMTHIILESDNKLDYPKIIEINSKKIQHTFRIEEIRNKNLQFKK